MNGFSKSIVPQNRQSWWAMYRTRMLTNTFVGVCRWWYVCEAVPEVPQRVKFFKVTESATWRLCSPKLFYDVNLSRTIEWHDIAHQLVKVTFKARYYQLTDLVNKGVKELTSKTASWWAGYILSVLHYTHVAIVRVFS